MQFMFGKTSLDSSLTLFLFTPTYSVDATRPCTPVSLADDILEKSLLQPCYRTEALKYSNLLHYVTQELKPCSLTAESMQETNTQT